jgi:hypothetical protein
MRVTAGSCVHAPEFPGFPQGNLFGVRITGLRTGAQLGAESALRSRMTKDAASRGQGIQADATIGARRP